EDIDIYRDLAGGVTSANILHGSANAIGGQTLVIKLRWGQPAAKLPFEGALPGIKFALGENPKRSNFSIPGQPRRYPATRMGVEETIRGAFSEARDYKKTWDEHNKRVAAGEKNLIAPRRDLRLEPLVEVLEGKRYVHSHCYREDEILMLLRVAKEFGFKVRTFQHVLEGYKVADELAAAGVGASTFSDWWAQKTLIDGRVYFDLQRDIAERAEREKEKKALIDKFKKAAEKKPEEKKPDAASQKPGEKKPEEKKPEVKKPEEKPKPPQSGGTDAGSAVTLGGAL